MEGQAKIIKAALALRNQNGGFLIIGFDNKTLKPDKSSAPPDVRSDFHVDKIQGLITKFASDPFEIFIDFPVIDGQEYPVLSIPPGVKVPISAKSEIEINKIKLISLNDVYIRTLNANNTPSSAKATWKDWTKIMDICFDNPEADIGRFMRRHLNGISSEIITNISAAFLGANVKKESNADRVKQYIDESDARFRQIIASRLIKLPTHGSWEISLLLQGEVPPHSANRDFLQLLQASNPSYSGWPIWHVNTAGGRQISDTIS